MIHKNEGAKIWILFQNWSYSIVHLLVKYVNPVFQLIWNDCCGEVGAWILTQQFIDFSQNILIV